MNRFVKPRHAHILAITRLILPFLILCLFCVSACTRLTDVIAYETSIERVALGDETVPYYETKALTNAHIRAELKSSGFTSFLWLHPSAGVTEWYANGISKTDTANVKSVSKALFSALVGIETSL